MVLLIILLEYWREEILHQRKSYRHYSNLKRLTWSPLALFLLCLSPPPHSHLSFDCFPLCSLCSSHIGFIHKHCRSSGTTTAPGRLHSSLPCIDHFTLHRPLFHQTQARPVNVLSQHIPQDYSIKDETRTPSTASHPAPSPCSFIFFLALTIFYYLCYGQRSLAGCSPWAAKNWTQLNG